jgi:ribonuclease P protein component
VRRLQSAQDHESLLKTQVVARSAHFVMHRACEPDAQGLRASVLVSKRHARQAVTRNLIRRQLDALILAHAHQLQPTRHLFRLTRPMGSLFISASSTLLKQAVRQELQHLLLTAPTPTTPSTKTTPP